METIFERTYLVVDDFTVVYLGDLGGALQAFNRRAECYTPEEANLVVLLECSKVMDGTQLLERRR